MSWCEKIKNIMDVMTDTYNHYKDAKSRLIFDIKELVQYGVYSSERLNFKSPVGTFYSHMHNENTLLGNIYSMRNEINNLENIVLNRYPSPEKLSQIINIKNKYFWRTNIQLKDIIQTEAKFEVTDVSLMIKDAMKLKVNNPLYANIARINYDSRIASPDMKDDFIREYISSKKTLKQISLDFEKRYGMHISISTISINSRKYLSKHGLDFKNRKDMKKYYSTRNIN